MKNILSVLVLMLTTLPVQANCQWIKNISVSNVGQSTATINWTTCDVSTSQVKYGTTVANEVWSQKDSTLVTSHSLILTGLALGTTYHYRVQSVDSTGVLVISRDKTFTTSVSPTVQSLSIFPSSGTVLVGGTQQFQAVANYSDGSQKDVTNTVQWNSANNQIAVVSVTGLATGIQQGGVTITATYINTTDSVVLTVTNPVRQVNLIWTDGNTTQDTYNVYRGTVSGGPYSRLNTTTISTKSYTDTNVTYGSTYYYVVTAINGSNQESAFSNQASAVVK